MDPNSTAAWKKRITERRETDPDPPKPAASAPPVSNVRFGKQFTPEERLRQQKALAEMLRRRAP